MIRDITSALWQFWQQFQMDGVTIAAYQTGTVPDAAAFPYITFEAPRADAFGTMPLAAHAWFRFASTEGPAAAIAQRIAFWEAVEQAIPHGGVMLPLPVGFLMIRRGSGDFLYAGVDEEDKSVLYGRVGYEVTYYTE